MQGKRGENGNISNYFCFNRIEIELNYDLITELHTEW